VKHPAVVTVSECSQTTLSSLLKKYTLTLNIIDKKAEIPGSYWGGSEAGLIADRVFVRPDTPIHSLLHETCHYICMNTQRRAHLDTDAAGDYDEENAVCYLQILLASEIPEMSREQIMQDMDSWGYTFRLGSAKAWFEEDAEDARAWLIRHQLITQDNKPRYKLRY
jgi:hypothetical protein